MTTSSIASASTRKSAGTRFSGKTGRTREKPVIFVFIYSYLPMFGVVMAFQRRGCEQSAAVYQA